MSLSLRCAVAVLTGPASSIGAALALGLAAEGADLALIDREAAALAIAADMAHRQRLRVSAHSSDLAGAESVAALPTAVGAVHQRASLAINNAGAALLGQFEQITPADFASVFDVNFWAACG